MSVQPAKNAIILAMFGTSVEEGLDGLLHIRNRISRKYPNTHVRMAFTSKVLRRIWEERAADQEYRSLHPEVPEEILRICGPGEVARSLVHMEIDSLVVQPVHIAPVKEESIRNIYLEGIEPTGDSDTVYPFQKIAVGRPVLGVLDQTYSYKDDIVQVARSLAEDFTMARKQKAALFYMGHGNKYPETKKVYKELVTEIRHQYPDVLTFMSMIEGESSNKDLLKELRKHKVDKMILKPFLVVGGSHVRKDMLGKGSGSLRTLLVKEGIEVLPVMKGLGENTLFADIFVQHTADAAREAGIELR